MRRNWRRKIIFVSLVFGMTGCHRPWRPNIVTHSRARSLWIILCAFTDDGGVVRGKDGATLMAELTRGGYFDGFGDSDRDAEGRILDGWGNPFVIIIEEDGCRVNIISFGPNGKDDGGKGDDSMWSVDLGTFPFCDLIRVH